MKLKINPCYNFEAWQIPSDKDAELELTRILPPKWIIDMLTKDELVLIDATDRTTAKVKSYYGWIPANQGDYIIHAEWGSSSFIFVCPEAARKAVFIEITDG